MLHILCTMIRRCARVQSVTSQSPLFEDQQEVIENCHVESLSTTIVSSSQQSRSLTKPSKGTVVDGKSESRREAKQYKGNSLKENYGMQDFSPTLSPIVISTNALIDNPNESMKVLQQSFQNISLWWPCRWGFQLLHRKKSQTKLSQNKRFLLTSANCVSHLCKKRNGCGKFVSVMVVLVFLTLHLTFLYFYQIIASSDPDRKNLSLKTTQVYIRTASTNDRVLFQRSLYLTSPRLVAYFPSNLKHDTTLSDNKAVFPKIIVKIQFLKPIVTKPLRYEYYRIDPNALHYASKRNIYIDGNFELQKAIADDDDYYDPKYINPDLTETCKLRFDWQSTSSIPSCNVIHEFDLTSPFFEYTSPMDAQYPTKKLGHRRKQYKLVAEGYWRSVFFVLEHEPILSRYSDDKISSNVLKRNILVPNKTEFRQLDSNHSTTSAIFGSPASDNDYSNVVVFKSIRFRHEFTPRNFDRMRRDVLIMERLSSSKFIVDIYAACGTSSFTEYGNGRDMTNSIFAHQQSTYSSTAPSTSEIITNNETTVIVDVFQDRRLQLDKLNIATQIAIGLAELHNMDIEGVASVAHTDISPNQYINVNGIYKLNDFNRARFIPFSPTGPSDATNSIEATPLHDLRNWTPCPYNIGNNPGKNRAPEEYNLQPQTEKVDIYSLGNIFYMLLQGEYPFYDVDADEAQRLVVGGHRPSFYEDIWNSTDPVNVALKDIMMRCHEQNPVDRPSARQVELFLKRTMQILDPERLEQLGLIANTSLGR